MTKEQVEKHGDVIKWFCDNADKGVWSRRNDSGLQNWVLTTEPNWESTYIFLQNDIYAEFRKALTDGKKVQLLGHNIDYLSNENWVDINWIDTQQEASRYRIKPKIKVGDWVTETLMNTKRVYQAKEVDIKGILSVDYIGDAELWEPKKNEWILVYNSITNKDEAHKILRKFNIMSHDNTRYIDTYGDVWKFAEPLKAVYNLNKDK